MKHIKLLLASSLLVLGFFSLKAQTFFLDSTVYYVHKSAPSLTPGLDFNTHFKELLLFDSVGHFGEYYTVERTPGKYNLTDSLTYKLRVFEDKVYFTGFLITGNNDTFEINNLLIYDFNLNVGDTFEVDENTSGLKYKLALDSIGQKVFDDGISRETYYWKTISGYNEFTLFPLHYIAKGIGSNKGLVCFPLTNRVVFWQNLISICKLNEPIYKIPDTYYSVEDFCNEDTIQSIIEKFRSVSVVKINKQTLKIYPNPVETILYIDDIKNEEFEIRDQLGKTVLKGYFENKIDVERLKTGIYQLIIKSNEINYTSKIIKL
jgi:hypothetical protein